MLKSPCENDLHIDSFQVKLHKLNETCMTNHREHIEEENVIN